jgi:poly(beta-D-mannuronate) lyase
MLVGGEKRAAWSVADAAVHRLEARIAIDRLPQKKPHVVCLQIHDADDDVVMLRLEGTKLFLERTGEPDLPITKDYQLGQQFDFVLTAGRGKITATYNGTHLLEWNRDAKNCYFKAGCYTQSNVAKGDDPNDYAAVAIYRLTISEARH